MQNDVKPLSDVSFQLEKLELKYRSKEILIHAYELLEMLKSSDSYSDQDRLDLESMLTMLERGLRNFNAEIVKRGLDLRSFDNSSNIDFIEELGGVFCMIILYVFNKTIDLLDELFLYTVKFSPYVAKLKTSPVYIALKNAADSTVSNVRYHNFYESFIINSPSIWKAFDTARGKILEGDYNGAHDSIKELVVFYMYGIEA